MWRGILNIVSSLWHFVCVHISYESLDWVSSAMDWLQYAKTAVIPRASLLDTEAKWLQSINANLVVSFFRRWETRNQILLMWFCFILLLIVFTWFTTLFHISCLWKQVSDIVPIACAAAAQAGIPSVCVTNFRFSLTSRVQLCEIVALPFSVHRKVYCISGSSNTRKSSGNSKRSCQSKGNAIYLLVLRLKGQWSWTIFTFSCLIG